MKVLMSADTVGGVWTYAMELARALQAHGVQIELATLGALPSHEQRAQVEALPNVRLHPATWKLEWMSEAWPDVDASGAWLLELERELQPDIVHLNGYAHAALPFRAPKIVVAHSDVLSWWRAVKNCDAPHEWDEYRARVQRGLRAADALVAPTRAVWNGMREHFDVPTPARVIFNGRDASGFSPGQKEPFIFAAGRLWDDAKNLRLLNEVAPRLAWPVYVAGPRESPSGGQVEAANVTLLGRLSDEEVRDWMGRAAIYCLPAKYEPFGLSALEAGLCGCALVLGNIASLREVWSSAGWKRAHHGNSWVQFVAANDALQLEKLLSELIASSSQRQRLSNMARHRALQLSATRMACGYLSLYRELVSARHRKLKRAAIHA